MKSIAQLRAACRAVIDGYAKGQSGMDADQHQALVDLGEMAQSMDAILAAVSTSTPNNLLDLARATNLREAMHGINAQDATMLLSRFVAALDAARASQLGRPPTAWVRIDTEGPGTIDPPALLGAMPPLGMKASYRPVFDDAGGVPAAARQLLGQCLSMTEYAATPMVYLETMTIGEGDDAMTIPRTTADWWQGLEEQIEHLQAALRGHLALIDASTQLASEVNDGPGVPVGHVDMHRPAGSGDGIRWTKWALPHGTALYASAQPISASELPDMWQGGVQAAISHLDYNSGAPPQVVAALRTLRDAYLEHLRVPGEPA